MKNKYMIGGFIIVVFLAIMGYLFTQSSIKYETNFTTVMKSDKTVKATGSWIKEKSYEISKTDKTFTFYMQDATGNVMKVVYDGTIPNNFETAKSVVVTGKYENGYFHAKDILTKCPSKYEDQGGQNVKTSKM